jgi:hypothetical protein
MTQDEISELASAAGMKPSDQLRSFAKLVAARQAERCSRLIWRLRADWMRTNDWSRCEDVCGLMARMEHEVRTA